LGATLVGRSFSGDKRQLQAILKAAIAHKGTVMLDVVSPCVTFNDHEGSTKSYKYVKEHEETLQDVSFVPHFEEIDVEYDPGTTVEVTMHDGSHLRLRKLEEDYDPPTRFKPSPGSPKRTTRAKCSPACSTSIPRRRALSIC
jgi:2-oxoglutarate ferredoxin oxidoreductase subunit beta